MAKHFGPGNHIHFLTSSRKDNKGGGGGGGGCDNDVDYDDEDDEEGLDEREPEKAICPDNQKMLFTALNTHLNAG